MSLIFLLVTGFSVGLSGAMIPGPLFLFTISRVLNGSISSGVKIIFGHILFEAIAMVAILVGFQSLLKSKILIIAISLVGGIALIVMGLLILFKANQMELSKRKENINFKYGAIIGGAFFSIISPGFLIWWATIGASLLLQAFLLGWIGVAIFTLGHWSADIGWQGLVSYSINKGKGVLSDRSFQNIMKALALMLIILGIYFGLKGVI